MKVLILGAGGFTARHLTEWLRQQPIYDLYFAARRAATEPNWFACDLTDAGEVQALLAEVRPARVYQLAGSFSNDYALDYPANVLITKNLLDSIRATRMACRVLLIGSSAEYGLVRAAENPISEEHELNPISVYGLTKIYQTYLMRLYCTLYQMDVVMARPFNLQGERMSPRLFVGRVQQQITDYLEGRTDKIMVGNLRHRRDYVGVEEVVRAYELILNYGQAGEVYNVGSGRSLTVADLLRDMLRAHGLDMEVVQEWPSADEHRLDVEDIYADLSKLKNLEARARRDRQADADTV